MKELEEDEGRPTHWNEDRPREGYQLALLGLTNDRIAQVMGVSVKTVEYWIRVKPEFREAVRKGRILADIEVVSALHRRATGAKVTEEHIVIVDGKPEIWKTTREYPPDTVAGLKWMALRHKDLWAEVQRTEITQTNVNINKIDAGDLTYEELILMKRIGMKQIQKQLDGRSN